MNATIKLNAFKVLNQGTMERNEKKNQRRNLKAIAKEITPQEFLIHWCAGTLLKPNLAFNLTYESLMDFECKVM